MLKKFKNNFIIVIPTVFLLSSCNVYSPKYTDEGKGQAISSTVVSLKDTNNTTSTSIKIDSDTLIASENKGLVATTGGTGEGENSNSQSSSNTSNTVAIAIDPVINKLSDDELKKILVDRQREEQELVKKRKEEKAEELKEKFLNGVSIGGIDLSSLTLDEAKEKIDSELMEALYSKEINYTVDGVKQSVTYGEIEAHIKDEIFDKAFNYGKDLGLDEFLALAEKGANKDFKAEFAFNEDYVKDLGERYYQRVRNDSLSKAISFEDEKVTINEKAMEKVMDKEAFFNYIKDNVNTDPESTDNKDIEIKKQKISLKESDLSKIDTELTSFSTDYSWSPENRRINIELAAKNIDNTLLMPGAEFSFNRTVGPQTKENGFKDSLVYVGNKTIYEPGGGICQVSTTLYNSILNLGIDPTERVNHGMTISYVPLGMDATVAEPYLDFKFKNTLKNPILIKTYYDGVNLTFSIYGHEGDLNGYSYKYESEVLNKTPYKTEIVEDPELPVGYEKVETTPYDGFEVKVYKYTYKDGKEVSKELYGEDKYNVVNEIIRRGTGDPNVKTWPEETSEE